MSATCFCLAMVAPWLRAPNTAHLAHAPAPYDVALDKVVFMRPMGQLQECDVDFLARSLEARLGVPVALLPPATPPIEAFDFESGQYDATEMLDWLFLTRPAGAWRYMAVLTDPLGTREVEELYGLANLQDRVAVMSLGTFRQDMRSPQPMRRAHARDQVARVAFHELVHTLGMPHCNAPGCLMSGMTRKEEIHPDTVACQICVSRIQASLKAPRDPHQEAIDLGDGYFRRGFFDDALGHWRQARPTLPWDADAEHQAGLENRMGAALMSLGRARNAYPHIRTALQLDPTLAPAHFNMATLQVIAGHEDLAVLSLERGATLEEDPVLRFEAMAVFYLQTLRDPGSALLALRHYRDAGGHDPDLLATLDHLEAQNLIVFDIDEVPIIEGEMRHNHQ